MLSKLLEPIIRPVLDTVGGIIGKMVKDKDLAAQLEKDIKIALLEQDFKEFEGRVKIVLAEAEGASWLQRSWRPILMLCIICIIFNNYVLFPYMSLFTDKAAVMTLPDGLWALLTTGVGGYVLARSGEKIASIMKNGKE